MHVYIYTQCMYCMKCKLTYIRVHTLYISCIKATCSLHVHTCSCSNYIPAIKKLPFAFRIEPFERRLRSVLHPLYNSIPLCTVPYKCMRNYFSGTLINAQAA